MPTILVAGQAIHVSHFHVGKAMEANPINRSHHRQRRKTKITSIAPSPSSSMDHAMCVRHILSRTCSRFLPQTHNESLRLIAIVQRRRPVFLLRRRVHLEYKVLRRILRQHITQHLRHVTTRDYIDASIARSNCDATMERLPTIHTLHQSESLRLSHSIASLIHASLRDLIRDTHAA